MCASRYLITGPLLTLVILLSACVFQQNQVDGTYHSLCAADNAPSDEGNTQRMPNYCGGVVPGNGKALGLSEHWAADVIAGVGTYGELFARNVGADSNIRLDRGLNRLWSDGGLMYAPPAR